MFRKLIKDIKRAVKTNRRCVSSRSIRNASLTAGMAKGYIDVLRYMGHEAMLSLWDENSCEGIAYLKIDSVILVYGGEIDRDGYKKLLKK